MQFKELVKWNRRFSVLYAAGIWTMVGTFGYYWYTGQNKERSGEVREEVPVDQNQVEFKTAHSRTIILYKKDFVPYTTRIYNFVRSFSEAPSSQHADTPEEGAAASRGVSEDAAASRGVSEDAAASRGVSEDDAASRGVSEDDAASRGVSKDAAAPLPPFSSG